MTSVNQYLLFLGGFVCPGNASPVKMSRARTDSGVCPLASNHYSDWVRLEIQSLANQALSYVARYAGIAG